MNLPSPSIQDQQWQEKGIDIWMIRDNLTLSYEARVEQHQNTIDCVAELKQGRCHLISLDDLIESKKAI